MKNLNNVEIGAVAGGDQIYYCEIIKKVGSAVMAKLLFIKDAYKNVEDIEGAYKAIKENWLGNKTEKDMGDSEYKFVCGFDDVDVDA